MPHKVILLLLFSFSTSTCLLAQGTDSLHTNAERMPYFAGCTAYYVGSKERRQCSNQSLKAYIFNHIIYPQAAIDANLEGAVYVRFVVDELGNVQQPELLKDIGGGCGTAALDMLANMPKWEPAYHRGRNVKVSLELPIHFYFKETVADNQDGYSIAWGNLTTYNVSRKALRRNLKESVQVFNAEGMPTTMSTLQFSYGKNKKLISKASSGKITNAMEKMVKKMKKGGQFSVIATIQKNGQFIEVVKDFLVSE